MAEAKSHFRKVENTYAVGTSNGDFIFAEYVSGDDLYDTSGDGGYDYDTSGEAVDDTYGDDVYYDTSGDFSGDDADEKARNSKLQRYNFPGISCISQISWTQILKDLFHHMRSCKQA